MGRIHPLRGLLVAGALIEVSLIGILCLGDVRQGMPIFFVLFGVAFLAYLFAVRGCGRMPIRTVVCLGLLFRLTLLLIHPKM